MIILRLLILFYWLLDWVLLHWPWTIRFLKILRTVFILILARWCSRPIKYRRAPANYRAAWKYQFEISDELVSILWHLDLIFTSIFIFETIIKENLKKLRVKYRSNCSYIKSFTKVPLKISQMPVFFLLLQMCKKCVWNCDVG